MAVCPAGHPMESADQTTWSDLVRYPLIALRGQFTEQLVVDLHGKVAMAAMRPRHEVAFMSTALSMVNAGLGVTTCLPYARTLVALCGLRMRLLHDPEVRRQFFFYSHRHASLSPAAEAFVNYLHEHVGARKSVVEGKSVSVRVALGGPRSIKK